MSLKDRITSLRKFDQYGNDIEKCDPDFYDETDIPVIYLEKPDARYGSATFGLEVKRLRNQHDIDVAKLPEEVFAKALEEAKLEESSHPDGIMHMTAMEHPGWFQGKKNEQIIQPIYL